MLWKSGLAPFPTAETKRLLRIFANETQPVLCVHNSGSSIRNRCDLRQRSFYFGRHKWNTLIYCNMDCLHPPTVADRFYFHSMQLQYFHINNFFFNTVNWTVNFYYILSQVATTTMNKRKIFRFEYSNRLCWKIRSIFKTIKRSKGRCHTLLFSIHFIFVSVCFLFHSVYRHNFYFSHIIRLYTLRVYFLCRFKYHIRISILIFISFNIIFFWSVHTSLLRWVSFTQQTTIRRWKKWRLFLHVRLWNINTNFEYVILCI